MQILFMEYLYNVIPLKENQTQLIDVLILMFNYLLI